MLFFMLWMLGCCLFSGTFDRLDGNGVMISGYNRNATVQLSDFSFLGGNAIARYVCCLCILDRLCGSAVVVALSGNQRMNMHGWINF